MLISATVCGLLVGRLAQLILNGDGVPTDWAMAIVAGLGGSFVGGLVITPGWKFSANRKLQM